MCKVHIYLEMGFCVCTYMNASTISYVAMYTYNHHNIHNNNDFVHCAIDSTEEALLRSIIYIVVCTHVWASVLVGNMEVTEA